MRTLIAAIALSLISASLTACGGTIVSHRPPLVEAPSATTDVVRIRMFESASMGLWQPTFEDVSCHYREQASESFVSVRMNEVASDSNGVIYHAEVPGASSGTTEYYFTWIDSSNTLRRVPAATNYPQEWHNALERNRQIAEANARTMQPATQTAPLPPAQMP